MQSLKTMFLGFLIMFLDLLVLPLLGSPAVPIEAVLILIGFLIALVGYFRKE